MRVCALWMTAAIMLAIAGCGGPARRRRRLVAYEYQQCRQHITWLIQARMCPDSSACTPDKVCWPEGR